MFAGISFRLPIYDERWPDYLIFLCTIHGLGQNHRLPPMPRSRITRDEAINSLGVIVIADSNAVQERSAVAVNDLEQAGMIAR